MMAGLVVFVWALAWAAFFYWRGYTDCGRRSAWDEPEMPRLRRPWGRREFVGR